jgi:ATP-binding cassette subfamily B (MDR/TAP) protein 1
VSLGATSEIEEGAKSGPSVRTTVTIAHRLSTIRSSDVIHVVEDGQVKETGSHEELLTRRGRYFELVQAEL